MSNYKYAIKKLPIKSWIKYWLWRNRTGGTKYKFELSDIKEGSNFYLENTIKRKFNIFEVYGKTTQNGTPTPENPIPIINLTGNINEKVQNANLFDLKSYLEDRNCPYTENEDGSLTFNVKQNLYSNRLIFSEEDIDVSLSGEIVEITANSCKVSLRNSNNVFVTSITNQQPIKENRKANQIYLDWSETGQVTMKNIMLNKGTTALPFIPHAEQNISFPLEEGQVFAEGDYLADDGIHHVRRKVVLDGTENISLWQFESLVETQRFILRLANNAINFSESLCSHLTYNSGNIDVPHFRFSGANEFIFYLPKSIANTAQEAKSWLAEQYNNGTPLELEYPLAEEVVEPFTEEQQIEYNKIKELYTYNEVTNIDGDANLKIKYWERIER